MGQEQSRFVGCFRVIEEIRVRGMGGIRSAALSFSGNFIVITGESGSGKSSLVRAFEFISGKRTQAASIHADCNEVAVEALWSAVAAPFADSQDDAFLTKRSLTRQGKGRCSVGGGLATLGQLSELSLSLIEIQSQFAQLGLLDPARQLELVDFCGGAELADAKSRLASLFPEMIDSEKELISLRKRRSELETELEGSDAKVRAIRALGLYPGCDKEWNDELASLEKRIAEVGRYEDLIYKMNGGEAEVDILDQLTVLLRELYGLAPESRAKEWSALGEEALSNLQSLFSSARAELDLVSREELDERYEVLERRVGVLRRLKRDVGVLCAEDLTAYAEEVEENMRWLRESNAILEEKQATSARLRAEVGQLARTLRARRESAAETFQRRVGGHLRDLAMEDISFSVQIHRLDKVRAGGAEAASFMLAVKDGIPNPVAKVASGGELSRILIAIQASLDAARLPGVLVFDEVEAGLGGRTALLAGKKLKDLSRSCRTILITHEATIAAMADQHFVVRRDGDETTVSEIAGEEREREIARMLAGSQTREALDHAKSLLERTNS